MIPHDSNSMTHQKISDNSYELDGISTASSFVDRRNGRCGSHHEVQRYKRHNFKGHARQHISEITSQDMRSARSAPKTETFGTNEVFYRNGLVMFGDGGCANPQN